MIDLAHQVVLGHRVCTRGVQAAAIDDPDRDVVLPKSASLTCWSVRPSAWPSACRPAAPGRDVRARAHGARGLGIGADLRRQSSDDTRASRESQQPVVHGDLRDDRGSLESGAMIPRPRRAKTRWTIRVVRGYTSHMRGVVLGVAAACICFAPISVAAQVLKSTGGVALLPAARPNRPCRVPSCCPARWDPGAISFSLTPTRTRRGSTVSARCSGHAISCGAASGMSSVGTPSREGHAGAVVRRIESVLVPEPEPPTLPALLVPPSELTGTGPELSPCRRAHRRPST